MVGPRSKVSLLDQHSVLKKKAEGMYMYSMRQNFFTYCSG